MWQGTSTFLFDYVITVCDNAKERCLILPGTVQTFYHNFPDPEGDGADEEVVVMFGAVREKIRQYFAAFVAQYLQ